MAVRFNAAAEYLSRTGWDPNQATSFSICAWVYISVDTNDYACFFEMDASGNMWMGLTGDGTQLEIYNGSSVDAGTTLTVGTWYHVALTWSSGSTQYGYLNGVEDMYLTGSTSLNDTTILIGYDNWSQQFNGRIAAIKMWRAAQLTEAEIAQEMNTILPVRTDNLYGWWPCFPGSGERVRDYSGNGRNWTENGTLSDEDPPPVSWGARPLPMPWVAAAPPIAIPRHPAAYYGGPTIF